MAQAVAEVCVTRLSISVASSPLLSADRLVILEDDELDRRDPESVSVSASVDASADLELSKLIALSDLER